MPRQKQVQPTFDECRNAYWAACARYEAARTDPYSTWNQINDAAADVSTARAIWVRRVETSRAVNHDAAARRLDAVQSVCSETGEPVEWVLNRAKRA